MKIRKLKDGSLRFYSGNKRATESQIKEYIRRDFDNIDKSAIPDEYKPYYGRVAGGKARAATAARIDGKYVYSEFVRKNKLDSLAEIRGFKNAKELLEKDKDFAKAMKNLYSSESGLEYSYNSDNIARQIKTFKGKIVINGKEYTQNKAIERIEKIDKKIKRKFDNFLNIFHVKYKKGGAILEFTLPTESDINNVEDVEDFELDGVDLIFSGKKK